MFHCADRPRLAPRVGLDLGCGLGRGQFRYFRGRIPLRSLEFADTSRFAIGRDGRLVAGLEPRAADVGNYTEAVTGLWSPQGNLQSTTRLSLARRHFVTAYCR